MQCAPYRHSLHVREGRGEEGRGGEGRGGEGRGGEGNYWQGQSQNVKGTFSTACRDQAMPFEQTGDRLALVALGVDQVLFQTLFAHTNELWQR